MDGFKSDFMIYTFLTGFGEIGIGNGVLMAIMFLVYLLSCTAGCIIAAVISFYRQKKNKA